MRRSILVGACCLWLTACGGGGGGGAPAAAGNAADELNPAAVSVERPPIDGRLPADLLPPA